MSKAANSARKTLASIGVSAKEIDKELRAYRKSAEVLSSSHPRLIDRYDGRWVGVVDGRVAVAGNSAKNVTAKLLKSGFAPERAIIRFIEKNRRTMIL